MKILLPTDGSAFSESAAHFLLRLNLSSRDEISILHVVSEDPLQDSDDYYSRRIREVKQFIAPKIIEHTLEILKPVQAKINSRVAEGYPDTCIIETAVKVDADLIIMGHKRVKGIRSHIVGSITKSVSINSPKPILVVKPPEVRTPDRVKILFPTDGSHYAQKVGELLTLIPFHDTTEITVLHVVTPALYDMPEQYMKKMDTGMKEDLKSLDDKGLRESEEVFVQTAKLLGGRFPHFERLTRSGDPTDEILQTSYDLKPDIIALGSKGMGGFRGVIGSISRYILSVAECSVLIGKA